MNIYLISQDQNIGYDTHDSAVVVAESEEEARSIHPGGYALDDQEQWDGIWSTWTNKEHVKVELIGKAINRNTGVVLASFNAG